ncbi:ribonuclease H-like domain-containing protein [Intrasporangium calvum]|uniref:Ribonuclease H-like domain-containing protein n=1 Tax=Intrasporangium calvum TaxID=53358 RepID=A0ABT5GED6_9MICO|nr:ribonuclease H-like domain-containing protein [Intrasporangium calvum]MDC5696513.1 ribonuclease H-like domain-containing protein [Intrasporangium calvum]
MSSGQANGQVVLGGYPAKRCARAVHNDFSPSSPPKPPVDEATQRLFDAGNAFEELVNQRLAQAPGAVLLSDEEGWRANADATLAAMRERRPVIVNGRLPSTRPKVGAPDVLVLMGDGYVPVDVKLHGTRNNAKRGSLWVSSLDSPSDRWLQSGLSDASASMENDAFQLSHYTRMLQTLGLHAGDDLVVGGIIGQSDYTDLGGDPWLVAWYDLGTPRKDTFSASAREGRARRTLLERYDHEFAFRLQVAEVAASGGELVRPLHVSECDRCVWLEYCAEVAGADDASFGIRTGLPTAQQWRFLYDRGLTTAAALAAADDEPPDGWSPRDSQPGPRADAKYRALVRRARMAVEGIDFEPVVDWPTIPAADIEVDFDIEWDLEQRIYLWGLRLRQGQDESSAVFDPVVSYEPLDDDGAARLAEHFASRLSRVIEDAEAAGRSVTIFHWSHPERSMTRKFAAVDALLQGRAQDLHQWFATHFFSRDGTSIKTVAPIFGFHWAVDDAGGVESQLRIEAARSEGDEAVAARDWLARYNESDVAAQAAIRDGLRAAARQQRTCP